MDPSKLKLICVDRFDGIEPFRGLGQLTPEQIGTLAGKATAVTAEQLQTAAQGWTAFRASDPRTLEHFIASDTSALPFLKAALQRHLQEFPWTSDGLTRTERQILQLVHDGISKPGQIFARNMDMETVYFIGDWPTFGHIDDLCKAPQGLLACANGAELQYPPIIAVPKDEFMKQRLQITDAGRAALGGHLDPMKVMQRDMWLGGVHISSGQPMWMWNEAEQRLELTGA